jgi:hypothetical protein
MKVYILYYICNGCVLVAPKSGTGERNWYKEESFNKCSQNSENQNIQNNKSGYKTRRTLEHNLHLTYNHTIADKDMRGNRGLNTQHVIDGIVTRCEGRQDKTNGKCKMDQRWLEGQ